MAKFIHGGDDKEPTTKRRPEDWADKLYKAATEKADRIGAEYRAKIANGDYSEASYREYTQKMQDTLQEYADQVLAHYRPG